MKIIYARQSLEGLQSEWRGSVFLAGPTPRSQEVKSWRPEAIELFSKYNFQGTLLVPEDEDGQCKGDYIDQVEWEEQGLKSATCILFWIPRNLKTMPALTTNDEWGAWKASGKVVLGVPDNAEKCKYQIYYANKLDVPFANNLEETVLLALKKLL